MMIDFSAIYDGTLKLSDLQNQITHQHLIDGTNAMINTILGLIATAKDEYVTFQPIDPHAEDKEAATPEERNLAWTLGHVIVHVTASGEETAANGSSLARGIPVTWRNRYETPWQTVTTVAQLHHRLEESRRMRLAFLAAWPDSPHLDVHWNASTRHGALNAIGYTLRGLKHDHDHLAQIAEIMRQAQVALG